MVHAWEIRARPYSELCRVGPTSQPWTDIVLLVRHTECGFRMPRVRRKKTHNVAQEERVERLFSYVSEQHTQDERKPQKSILLSHGKLTRHFSDSRTQDFEKSSALLLFGVSFFFVNDSRLSFEKIVLCIRHPAC